MVKKIYYIFPLLLTLLLATGCDKEPTVTPEPDPDAVKLRLLVNTPGASRGGTRAVAESDIDEVSVLVMENTGSGYVYRYLVTGYSLSAVTGQAYDYEFLARLVPTTNSVRLYIIANGGAAINSATSGMTEAQVKAAITAGFGSAGFDSVLPMTGYVDLPQLNADATVTAVLVRSAARVDVINNAADFTLTSVKVYRATDLVQLIPDAIVGNVVTVPSVPAGAARNVNTGTFTVTGNSITEQIYIPESDIPAVADRRLTATSVVVGGVYAGSGVTTYYRMDFDPDDDTTQALFGQVLRNHIYRFEISDVLAPGWDSDDKASIYPSTGIELEIKAWDAETMFMVFDDYDYLGVSTRTVTTGSGIGSARTVAVDTSLDTYTAYWGNADGTYDPAAPSATLGGDADDPDGLFNAEISADGETIIITALQAYDAASDLPKYLVLVAGRMRIVITVTQASGSTGDRLINIIGSNFDIGSWGNYQPGEGWNPVPGERAYGLGNMLMGSLAYGPQNFGPGLTVDIPGINLAGVTLTGNQMPRNVYQNFDILYLTYATNTTAIQAADILQWLDESDNRFLVVQYDTAGTNANMMSALGLTFISGATAAAFNFLEASAPEFVTTGPFGTITEDFTYKCRDGTYGTITAANATAQGFIPILLSTASATAGNYTMAVNPERRIVVCGDCDIYSNSSTGSGTYNLNGLTATSAATLTINPANPAHVMMGNLFAWMFDTVLSGDDGL